MNNLEALSASVNYPVDEIKLQKALIDRSINPDGAYSGVTKAFELATADIYVLLVSSANISEGGFQISMTDKSNMMKIASGIFDKYGVENPLKPKIKNRSYNW